MANGRSHNGSNGHEERPDHEDIAERIREAATRHEVEEQQERLRTALHHAQKRVEFFPSVGKFIIPEQNTWAAHAEIVKNERNTLSFSPERYVYFDKIIAEKSGIRALHDASDPNYRKYEGLRTNLEALRNDIIGIYLNDSSFDPGDEKYIPHFQSIATAIGEALANDSWIKRPFTRSISIDLANVEGVGAAEIYKYLLSIQEEPGVFKDVVHKLKTELGMTSRIWELPPLEQTPFSPANLAAPLSQQKTSAVKEELAPASNEVKTPPKEEAPPKAAEPVDIKELDACERMIGLSGGLGDTARKLRSIDSLEEPLRVESIEEARKILRWLKNLQFTDKDMEEWLDQGTPAEQVAKTEALQQVVRIYAMHLKEAVKNSPEFIRGDAVVEDASNAAGAMALAVAEHTLRMLPENHPEIPRLEALIAVLPEESGLRQSQSVIRLIETLEIGLERASGKAISDLSPVDRLLEMSQRIQVTAHKLRSLDTLEPPAREESIELAREILRKLRKLSFSDKPMEEIINTGRPEDKAAFAQQIDEMVDVYKNLLFEAAQINPNIMQDQRIKAANDAVGGFAHSVKLMAAKEIPVSAAATQQISADVAQMPEEWKDMHNRTIDRLVKNMEGGLEKAVNDLQAQQEQDEDLAQEIIDSALLYSDSARRKKRKKRGSSKSGLGGKKQRKQMLDLTADDYVLKQGRFAKDAKITQNESPAGLQSIKAEDLAAIKALGGSLRDIGNQLKDLSTSVTQVADGDKIVPDDKTLTQTHAEREKQPNPRGNSQGPRV